MCVCGGRRVCEVKGGVCEREGRAGEGCVCHQLTQCVIQCVIPCLSSTLD